MIQKNLRTAQVAGFAYQLVYTNVNEMVDLRLITIISKGWNITCILQLLQIKCNAMPQRRHFRCKEVILAIQ